MKISDTTDEAWITAFNEQAKEIIGCSADDLYKIKKDETEDIFQQKLKELLWKPRIFQVVVTQAEYMNEKSKKLLLCHNQPSTIQPNQTCCWKKYLKRQSPTFSFMFSIFISVVSVFKMIMVLLSDLFK